MSRRSRTHTTKRIVNIIPGITIRFISCWTRDVRRYLHNTLPAVFAEYCKTRVKQLLPIAILGLSSPLFAQDLATDSLEKLYQASNDTGKVILLNKLSKKYQETSIGQSLTYAKRALALAENLKNEKWAIQSLNQIGVVCNNLSDYEKGLGYHLRAVNLAEKSGLSQELGKTYNNIGGIYYNQEDYENAFVWFSKALVLRQESGDTKRIAGSLNNVGEIHRIRGDYDLALEHYFQALKINEELNNQKWIAINCVNIGETYQSKGVYNEVLPYYQRSLQISVEIDDSEHIAMSYIHIGRYYNEMLQPNKAIEHFTRALKLSRKIAARILVKQALKGLSESCFLLDRFEESLLYYQKYNSVKDSIFDQKKHHQVTITQTRFETEKREREIALLRKDSELQAVKLNNSKAINYAYTGGFILLMLLAFYLLMGYRQRRKINEQLKDRVEFKKMELSEVIKLLKEEIEGHKNTQGKLEAINAELNNFMYRSSHDIKAPLASIIGLANIAKDEPCTEQRLDYIELISVSTQRLSAILDTLLEATKVTHSSVEISSIKFEKFIQQVVSGLENAEYSKGVNVRIDVDEDLQLYSDQKLLTTVMQNLIDNAMKYKNGSIKYPYVQIMAETRGDFVEITVSDNGQGIATEQQPNVFEMFVRANQDSQGTGLGLYIVKKAVDRLNGEIALQSTEGLGSIFTIMIPSSKEVAIKKSIKAAFYTS